VGVICGTATAGIPHAAYVSHLLKLPMIYVRNKAKTHGRAKAIEGEIKPNTPVVVIEDLLSTGNSCLEVVKILRRYKVKVLGVASIFSYGMLSCTNNFQQHQCPVYALSTLDDLLPEAIKKKYITKQQAEQIVQFRDHPNDTG
jgi:orotate phosphoribosyltransferase